ncbi:hypothetical protein [Vibrio phage BX-1]|nr:hypothetical protein [Vibrio phage BX-1]
MKTLSHNRNRVNHAITEQYNEILAHIRALGYYCYHKNMTNGRVPHTVVEIPTEINGVIYFRKYSICYFHAKKEVRLFDNYGVFDQVQNVWAFESIVDLRNFLHGNMKDMDLVKYTYQKGRE